MDMCVVCGKNCDDKSITKGGKTFCCAVHLKEYEGKGKKSATDNVCEFC